MGKKPFKARTNASKRRQKQKNKKKTSASNIDHRHAILKKTWDKNKTVQGNLKEMGLAMDPNKAVPVKTLRQEYKEKLEQLDKLNNPDREEDLSEDEQQDQEKVQEVPKSEALKELEAESKKKIRSRFEISEDQMHFCVHMLETHGDGNYKKMARDFKNYYQLTPAQIKNQINQFKKSKSWEYYKQFKEGEGEEV